MTRPRLGRVTTAWHLTRLGPIYLAYGAFKRLVPIRTLARWSWRPARGTSRNLDAEQRLVSSVLRLSRASGSDRDCLQRSLVLYRELSRAGADPTLVVGFRRTDRGLEGHAWVETDGVPVAEPTVREQGFETTCAFGRGGNLVVLRKSPSA
jgi:hypothetical protein